MTMSNFPPRCAGGLLCGSLALSSSLHRNSPPHFVGALVRPSSALLAALRSRSAGIGNSANVGMKDEIPKYNSKGCGDR